LQPSIDRSFCRDLGNGLVLRWSTVDDTERLVTALIASYEQIAGRRLFPADPVRLFILWIADIIVQEGVIINESAKQNVPRYAEGEYLDSLAELFKDTERLQAVPARTTLRFSISAAQNNTVTIPPGTRVSVGEIMFATVRAEIIMPDKTETDVPAVCTVDGAIGNGFLPGQISQIVDLFPFFDKVENITRSEGGADVETDAAFLDRLRWSMESFSTAGPLGAYVYWTKTASARITDVSPTSPTPGVAEIFILLENAEMPDEEMKQLVYNTLNADTVRPFTDKVVVSAPHPKKFKLDVTYYIPQPDQNSETVIRERIAAAVSEYIRWQTTKMGRDINPQRLIMLCKNAGAKRLVIRSPAFTLVQAHEVAVLDGEPNVQYGGLEVE
jgi:phage-related baseplate assembly protein